MSFETQVQEALDKLSSQPPGFFANTLSQQDLVASGNRVADTLSRDIARVKKEAGVLFEPLEKDGNGEGSGQRLATLFEKWRADAPSTTAVLCAAAEHFNIPPDNKNLQAALMTGIAADVKIENAYHDNNHFREVTSVMIRLLNANNELAEKDVKGTAKLSADDVAKCLASAAAHDLMHDGVGNTVNGVHEQYRLENKAIAAAEPFMKLAGMSPADMEDIRVMIRVTDISGKPSPHSLLRQTVTGQNPELPPALAALKEKPKLAVMSALMSDADLGPSAATDYSFSRKMTGLVSKETPALKDSDATLVGFMQFVVGNQFTSAAGEQTAQKSLKGIFNEASRRKALAEQPALEATAPAQPQTKKPQTPPPGQKNG